ncbi:MAG: lysophospholipid acyltransferase family protein [Pseudomonadota bacterium]
MAKLRAALFLLNLALSLVVFVPVLLLTVVLPVDYRFYFARLWIRYTLASLSVIGGISVELRGLEHISRGPVIYFIKHQSTLETIVLQGLLPPFSWVLKKQVFYIPLFGWGLAILKPIAIDRTAGASAVTQVKEQGLARLAEGRSISIFPEGTRKVPGSPPNYKIGGGVLAEAADVPIVPVAVNTGLFWPPKSLLIGRRGKAVIEFGPPMDVGGLDAAEITAKAQAWIEPNTDRLLEEGRARLGH